MIQIFLINSLAIIIRMRFNNKTKIIIIIMIVIRVKHNRILTKWLIKMTIIKMKYRNNKNKIKYKYKDRNRMKKHPNNKLIMTNKHIKIRNILRKSLRSVYKISNKNRTPSPMNNIINCYKFRLER